jgi:nitrite reductase/ring-hydroxylating ferredoxin subunit/uncharacterized membrane protein
MGMISRLEQASALDGLVTAGQRAARLIRPGWLRNGLNGVWVGHPLHPALVHVPVGAWLSAGILDLAGGDEQASRALVAAGLAAALPTAVTGAADWSEQHEQQMRVGVVHAAGNMIATALYGASLVSRRPPLSRALRLAGLAAASGSAYLGGHMAFRLAGGANHAEAVPHLIEPGWHHVLTSEELPDDWPTRRMLGEVPVVLVRLRGKVHALADRCSHMSGSLAEGDLADGCLTCPWHGSTFRVCDGSVARGPATAPQPAFQAREVGGAIQVCLPGAG